jgi:putative DNA primase/helicase
MLCLKGRVGKNENDTLNSWADGREKLVYTLPCKNGLLCWDSGKAKIKPVLMKHNPRYFSLYALPYDYDPSAKCPNWEAFLDDVMLSRKDYITVLQQFIGYLFRPDLREQKFLLCCGEGSNGKGVFFEVIQSLVGDENCSQVSLTRFNDRFALSQTMGKIVNMTAESSHIIADEAENTLKSYVAGDTFTFERKFKDPISAVPTAKLIITTNALPRFRDKTQAVWRRIILIPFDKVIPANSQIRDLASILKKELSGILNWAIAGLENLNAKGFIIPESNRQLIDEYRADADPCRAFLMDNYFETQNETDYIDSSELYMHYTRWCKESGFEPVNCRLFGQQVKRVLPRAERQRVRTNNGREYRYHGISRISEACNV